MSDVTLTKSMEQSMNQYAIEWENLCLQQLDSGGYDSVRNMIDEGVVYFGQVRTFIPNSLHIFPLVGIARKLFSESRFHEIQLIAQTYFAHGIKDRILSSYLIMANHQIKRAIQIDPIESQEVIATIQMEKAVFEKGRYQGGEKMDVSIAAIQHYLSTLERIQGCMK